jgi:hypothetical protein
MHIMRKALPKWRLSKLCNLAYGTHHAEIGITKTECR